MIPTVPVGLRLQGRNVLVVGAGPIAARKTQALLAQGALVHVVAPAHSPAMASLKVARRSIRVFRQRDLDGVWFVVTATGVPDVDSDVYESATSRRIWCNAADDPDNCSVLLPAVIHRDDVTISISTGGTSPASASWLRRQIENLLEDGALPVVAAAATVRRQVRAAGLATEVPGWAEVLDDGALALAKDGRVRELRERLLQAVAPQLEKAS